MQFPIWNCVLFNFSKFSYCSIPECHVFIVDYIRGNIEHFWINLQLKSFKCDLKFRLLLWHFLWICNQFLIDLIYYVVIYFQHVFTYLSLCLVFERKIIIVVVVILEYLLYKFTLETILKFLVSFKMSKIYGLT